MQNHNQNTDYSDRLKELEEENARLRAKAAPRGYRMNEGTYKGHPVLTFEAPNGRWFGMGCAKLEILLNLWDHEIVEEFLQRHSQPELPDYPEPDEGSSLNAELN